MASNDKISLMTAAVVGDIAGSAGRIEMTKAYATAPVTLGLDFGTLRTSMFAGSTGYTATDPITAGAASFTSSTFSTLLSSTTALATPGALGATAFNAFASTVSGAVLMGFGTTADVTLKNRAGTDVLTIGPNTTAAVFAGATTSTGNLTVGASTFVVTAATGEVSAGIGTFAAATAAVLTVRSTNTSAQVIVDTLGAASVSSQVALQNTGVTKWQVGYQIINSAGAFEIYDTVASRVAMKVETGAAGLMTLTGPLAITGALTGVTNFTASGRMVFGGTAVTGAEGTASLGGVTRTTIGANGAASALTANPLGYLDAYVGGTAVQIPYYTRGA